MLWLRLGTGLELARAVAFPMDLLHFAQQATAELDELQAQRRHAMDHKVWRRRQITVRVSP
jgi:hypothetical protein